MHFVRSVLRLAVVAAAVAVVSGPTTAFAEKKKGSVVELPDQIVTGRLAGPRVSVEITRVTPSIALSELRPPFAEKISQALSGSSF